VNQVLSQNEVDALLAAVSDGDVASPASSGAASGGGGAGGSGGVGVEDRKVTPYD